DESMGSGGLILRHTRAGIATHLICATYGEAGWTGKPPGAKKEDLAEIRAKELEAAAAALALSGVELWDYPDGGVTRSDQQEITQRVWDEISKRRPRVVVGWGPDGAYGHPDHIAMGACTDAAVAAMTEGEKVDVVIELDADEVMMKVRAIDCHRSQLEDWRIAIRDHPHLLQNGYGHEPYIAISSRAAGLTEKGLLGEFA
ncbi:MAG: PIG-L family deacetylase, partial [Chloroflexi bacterium]